MIALVWALVSACAYGMSDYLGGWASRRVPAILVICCAYPLSILFVGALVPFVPGEFTAVGLAWGIASGVASGLAVWTFYEALARGPMSIISPVAAVITAGLPVLVGIATGERPSLVVMGGIVAAICATVLVSLERPDPAAKRSFTLPIAALTVASGVLFAAYLIMIAQVPEGEGMLPLTWSRIGATVVVLLGVVGVVALRRRARQSSVRPDGPVSTKTVVTRLLPLAAVIAMLDVLANSAYYFASQQGMLSVVSVMTSLYPAVTVLAALTHGGERLRGVQVMGLAVAAASVVLITVG